MSSIKVRAVVESLAHSRPTKFPAFIEDALRRGGGAGASLVDGTFGGGVSLNGSRSEGGKKVCPSGSNTLPRALAIHSSLIELTHGVCGSRRDICNSWCFLQVASLSDSKVFRS